MTMQKTLIVDIVEVRFRLVRRKEITSSKRRRRRNAETDNRNCAFNNCDCLAPLGIDLGMSFGSTCLPRIAALLMLRLLVPARTPTSLRWALTSHRLEALQRGSNRVSLMLSSALRRHLARLQFNRFMTNIPLPWKMGTDWPRWRFN
jgi:hypothetical protein